MTRRTFEGWYYKHQFHHEALICIPSIYEEDGHRSGFIQLVFKDQMHYLEYEESEIGRVSDTCVELGKNVFTSYGIHLDNEWMVADLSYGALTPLRYDIMGIFAYMPNMECRHGVLSLYHEVHGEVMWEQERIKVEGVGYIEKDRGTAFPSEYCWFQSNAFQSKACVLFAMAKIPIFKFNFWGHFAVIFDGEKEYRFATYLGAKLLQCDEHYLRLKQGNYYLRIRVDGQQGIALKAPNQQGMQRMIHEAIECEGEVWLFKKRQLIFHEKTSAASYGWCINEISQ